MRRFLLLYMLLFFIPGTAPAAEYFVSPTGNDQNPGTKNRPFATLERARDEIRRLKSNRRYPHQGVTVWLRGGYHVRTQTFALNEQDSGLPEAQVVYRAFPGESVHLSGGRSLPAAAFGPVRDPSILQRLLPEARSHVLQIDLSALGITDYGKHQQYGHALPVVPAPLELFFDHRIMQLAHYPNSGSIPIGEVLDPGSIPRIRDYENIRGGTFVYTDDRHKRWLRAEDIWLQGTFKWGFADDKIKIKSIDTTRHTVSLCTPHMYGISSDEPYNQYVAWNLLEELDAAGEWYVDRPNGILYFWPPQTISDARISISMLEEPLIALEGAGHIIFCDLIIEEARGMGIYIERGEDDLIAGCTLRNIGTSAIFMGQGARQTFPHITHDDYDGVPVAREIGNLQGHIYKYTTWDRKAGKNLGVLSCDIYDTGCGGVVLSGGSKKNLIPGNCYVINCKIHNYNRRNKFLWAGINVDGCGNRIAHNEIYNSDFQAIYVHGNDHLFEYNLIHDIATNSNDTSPWYIGRDPSDRGHVIRYNFFHHCGNPQRKWTMGVYFDDASCGALVHGNVFYKVGSYGTIYSNAGHDLTVRNNIFVAGYGPVLHIKSMWYDFGLAQRDYYFGEKGVYRRRLTELLNIKEPPYSDKYPELTDWMDLMADGEIYVGMRPRRNLFANNLIYQHHDTYVYTGEYAQFELRGNYIAVRDPGFIDLQKMNLQLKDDSEVYDKIPGFEKIPFEKIGLYRDEFRTASDPGATHPGQ